MTRVKIFEQTFVAGDGTDLVSEWNFDACPDSVGLEVHSNGANGINANAEQGNSVETDTDDSNGFTPKATFAPNQYAGVKVGVASLSYSPGAMVMCDQASNNDYGVDPVSWGGGLEIFKHTGGSWSALGSGGGTLPVVTDWLWVEYVDGAIEGFINSTSQLSTTDSDFFAGQPGCYDYAGTDGATISDMEAGNISSRIEPMKHRKARGADHNAARQAAQRIARNPRHFAGV